MLVWSLMLMGIATFGIGLLPNYARIGVGRLCCSSPAASCRASRSAVSGAVRSCCRWSTHRRSGAVLSAAWWHSAFPPASSFRTSCSCWCQLPSLRNIRRLGLACAVSGEQYSGGRRRLRAGERDGVSDLPRGTAGEHRRACARCSTSFDDMGGRCCSPPAATSGTARSGTSCWYSSCCTPPASFKSLYQQRHAAAWQRSGVCRLGRGVRKWSDQYRPAAHHAMGNGGLVLWSLIFFPLLDTRSIPLIALALCGTFLLQGAYIGTQPAVFAELFPLRSGIAACR